MPRYFFHIQRHGSAPVLDDEGMEFEDLETAKHEAVASVRDLVADAIRSGGKVSGLRIVIMDEKGKSLDTIHASELFD